MNLRKTHNSVHNKYLLKYVPQTTLIIIQMPISELKSRIEFVQEKIEAPIRVTYAKAHGNKTRLIFDPNTFSIFSENIIF